MTTTPEPTAYAAWADDFGSTYCWPQGFADNRISRVHARILRFDMACDPHTLRVFRTRTEADLYIDALHAVTA